MRPWRHGWIFAAAWLFYLNENLTTLWHRPDGWARTLGLAALAGFAVAYLGGVAVLRHLRLNGQDVTGRVWLVLLILLGVLGAATFEGTDIESEPALLLLATLLP